MIRLLGKKRSIIAALTAAATVAVLPAGAFALSIDSIDINGEKLLVCGSTEGDGEILLNVYKDRTSGDNIENIIYISQKAAENGKFSFEFNIKNAADTAEGKFFAEASDFSDQLKKREFSYYKDASIDGTREEINKQTGKDSKDQTAIDELKKLVKDNRDKLAAAYIPFDKCLQDGADKSLDELCELLSYNKAFDTNDALRNAVKRDSTIVLIGNCSSADMYDNLESYVSGLSIENSNSYKNYINMKSDARKNAASILAGQTRPFKSEKDFMRAFDTAAILAELKARNGADACARLLSEYPEYFSLDGVTGYNYKNIMKGITDGSIRSIDDINKVLGTKEPSDSDGRGNGGSGGGGGGGNRVYSPQNPKPEIDSDAAAAQNGTEVKFNDIDGYEWAQEAIKYLSKYGVICGYDEVTFAPGENVTRAQLSKMVCLALSFNAYDNGEKKFGDVDKSDWCYEYVDTLSNLGIVNGTTDGKFEPDRYVTREEMAAIAYRALKAKNLTLSADGTTKFSDSDSISEFAAEAVRALSAEGLLQGDENGCFNAGANATRAETAKFVYSLCMRCGGIN